MLILSLVPTIFGGCSPKIPTTLESSEIDDFDFFDCAKQIYYILNALYLCNIINEVPFENIHDVDMLIRHLIDTIDLDSSAFQQAEKKYVRVQYEGSLLVVEFVLGV